MVNNLAILGFFPQQDSGFIRIDEVARAITFG